MERGESLDLWSQRSTPDRNQAFSVRASLFSYVPDVPVFSMISREVSKRANGTRFKSLMEFAKLDC